MNFKFCPLCAAPLVMGKPDDRQRLVCSQCEFIYYENPTPAAGILLAENNEILLVKRKYPPAAGTWSLPAGFIEKDENPRQTAIRETLEETGLHVKLTKLFDAAGSCISAVHPIVLILYEAEFISGELVAGDDAEEAQFFPFTALPQNIAFSTHRAAIEKIIQERS